MRPSIAGRSSFEIKGTAEQIADLLRAEIEDGRLAADELEEVLEIAVAKCVRAEYEIIRATRGIDRPPPAASLRAGRRS